MVLRKIKISFNYIEISIPHGAAHEELAAESPGICQSLQPDLSTALCPSMLASCQLTEIVQSLIGAAWDDLPLLFMK